MAKNKDIRLNQSILMDLIRTDGCTQHRLLEPEFQAHYGTMMEAGIEFPPIELVFDGKDYWIWDGFHRFWASRDIGRKEIIANVKQGSLRDAKWLSFSANKDHGIPRPLGFAKIIIERIAEDPKWRKKKQQAIADHVGVTQQCVSKIMRQIKAELSQVKNQNTTVVKRTGGGEHEDSDEKSSDSKRKVFKDNLKQPVPDKLQELWIGRTTIQDFIGTLDEIKNEVKRMFEVRDKRLTYLQKTTFEADIGNLRRLLKGAVFHAVCPACGGSKCKLCKNLGLMPKRIYDLLPEEFRS